LLRNLQRFVPRSSEAICSARAAFSKPRRPFGFFRSQNRKGQAETIAAAMFVLIDHITSAALLS
jgi:hypothetical protein